MYYEATPERQFRFGDIIRGFVLAATNIDKPNTSSHCEPYSIDVDAPQFCVILSPCCSIGEKTVLLTSLIKIKQSFLQNPYFQVDLTRINREMEPEQMLPPSAWEGLDINEKMKRKTKGRGYASTDNFIYPEHELLSKYLIKIQHGETIQTGYYMIDFRHTHKVNSQKITKGSNAPEDTKFLQLTPTARQELREKVSYFYGRIPDEDKEYLNA